MTTTTLDSIEHIIRTKGVISSECVMDMVREIRRLKAENIGMRESVDTAREILRNVVEGGD